MCINCFVTGTEIIFKFKHQMWEKDCRVMEGKTQIYKLVLFSGEKYLNIFLNMSHSRHSKDTKMEIDSCCSQYANEDPFHWKDLVSGNNEMRNSGKMAGIW